MVIIMMAMKINLQFYMSIKNRIKFKKNNNVSKKDVEYQGGAAYKAIIKLFADQLDDEKFAEHCKKFFKGNNDN